MVAWWGPVHVPMRDFTVTRGRCSHGPHAGQHRHKTLPFSQKALLQGTHLQSPSLTQPLTLFSSPSFPGSPDGQHTPLPLCCRALHQAQTPRAISFLVLSSRVKWILPRGYKYFLCGYPWFISSLLACRLCIRSVIVSHGVVSREFLYKAEMFLTKACLHSDTAGENAVLPFVLFSLSKCVLSLARLLKREAVGLQDGKHQSSRSPSLSRDM